MVANIYESIDAALQGMGYRGIDKPEHPVFSESPGAEGVTHVGVHAENPHAAAAAHGMMLAQLILHGPAGAKAVWFSHILGRAGLGAADIKNHAEALRELDAWYEAVVRQLSADSFEFQLYLPGEQTASEPDDGWFAVRSGALANWCQMLGSTLNSVDLTVSEESQEFLQDLVVIAEAIPEATAFDQPETDHSLGDLTEIEEYLRVGAMLLYEELQRKEQGLEQD